MKTLYLMRHGETLFNQLNKVQGWCDSPLTEKGIQQGETAKKYFSQNQITFDACYCSTQERASDTLELIIGDQQYTRLKALKEMGFGVFEGENSALQPVDPESYEQFYVAFGGESGPEVQQRIFNCLNEIMEKNKGENILVVSHNGAIFSFLKQIFPGQKLPVGLANCGFIKFNYQAGTFNYLETIDPALQGNSHEKS